MTYPEPDADRAERVVALLESILSEQRAMGARQAEAIENQRHAIEMQQQAGRRVTRILISLFVAVVVMIVVAALAPDIGFWLAHR
jgi:hypothetical protein